MLAQQVAALKYNLVGLLAVIPVCSIYCNTVYVQQRARFQSSITDALLSLQQLVSDMNLCCCSAY